jgi:hypothetical protein
MSRSIGRSCVAAGPGPRGPFDRAQMTHRDSQARYVF